MRPPGPRRLGRCDHFFPSSNPGERNGKFHLGKGQLTTEDKGDSRISLEKYAIALVDELEKPEHRRQRFTIGYYLTACSLRATTPVKNTHNPCRKPSGFHSSFGFLDRAARTRSLWQFQEMKCRCLEK
jgi:hypothetical protein